MGVPEQSILNKDMPGKKKDDARRSRPDLGVNREDLTPAKFVAGQPLEDALVASGDFSTQMLQQVIVRHSLIEGVSFAQAQLNSVRLNDARLIRCDLSNAIVCGLEARRVEFIDCRLIGIKAVECRMEDVLLERCDARYAQFQSGGLRTSEFVDTQFQEADFRAANLANTLWIRSALSHADLTGAKLTGADLCGAATEGMLIGAADLSGAIVSPSQAMEFARLLGLIIR